MKNGKTCGWTGRILHVDLGTGKIEVRESMEYQHRFIGGKGVNHRLAWDELSGGTRAFDPANCLFISVGPLTGSAAPCSGRACISGVSAQSYPETVAHSIVGGWFPAAVKYAGYDTIIITGKSPQKCYLYIDGESVNIRRADEIWGLGTYDTQRILKRKHGRDTHTLCIGPAGENLSRIAALVTDTGNAAEQGGFGGVAGSKNLKGLCVKGPHSVEIAHPRRLQELRKKYMHARQTTPLIQNMPYYHSGQSVSDLPFPRNRCSCSHACDRHCYWFYRDVPGASRLSLLSGLWEDIGMKAVNWHAPGNVEWPLWTVSGKDGHITADSVRAGFEASRFIRQYGLNERELLAGIVPWLVMADRTGLIREEKETFKEILPIDTHNPEWWENLIKVITYRKGAIGEILSQGVTRAITELGPKFQDTLYSGYGKKISTKISLQAARGYSGHWTGRGINSGLQFPFYLINALAWMTATRDPMDDTRIVMNEKDRRVLENVEKNKMNPYSMTLIPRIAVWHENRSQLKSSLTLCNRAFPDIKNTELESQLLSAVTGIQYSEEELDRVGERCKNMQRALLIRDYHRDFKSEFNEIMPWFERPDGTKGISVQKEKFSHTVQEYYKLRGWDENGRPSGEKLTSLGLEDISGELVRLGKIT
ncbi:MAG: hypothetical protein GY765_30535 [bacterium]|nr:hypothetical protein [bacterium]